MNIAQLAVDGIAEFGEYESWHFDDRWYTNCELVENGCRLATVLAERGVRQEVQGDPGPRDAHQEQAGGHAPCVTGESSNSSRGSAGRKFSFFFVLFIR